MQVNAEQTDPCTLVLDILVDEKQVARAFETSYREFGRYASIPGFRPGKAPRSIVERYVDAERVRQHTLEKLLRETYPQAVEDQGITPYRDPRIEPTDLEDKKEFSYRATIPLEPQVTLGEYIGFTIEQPVFNVTDEMVTRQIEQLRSEHTRLERVKDRGVEAGDVLIADVQTVLEGDENPAPARRQLIQFGNSIPGFEDALIGLQVGEERSVELTYPEDYHEEDKSGKKATFNVKLSSISTRRLPELDDEFAGKVGGFETFEELKESVEARLKANAIRISDEIAEQRIIEQILNHATVNFPQALVTEEVQEKYRLLSVELRQQGASYEDYLSQTGQTQESHQENVYAQSETQIRSLLALREVAKQEGLQATDEAIDAEFEKLVTEGRITEEQYDEYSEDPRRRMQVANALIQQALHEFLFSNSTIVQVVQQEPSEEVVSELEAAEEPAEE